MSTKYHSRKCNCRCGHIHDSKKEAQRCNELQLLQRAGEISELEIQQKITLLPCRKYENMPNEREIVYIADFVYKQGKTTIIEDTKGFKTKDYIIKRKLLKDKYCRGGDVIFREV